MKQFGKVFLGLIISFLVPILLFIVLLSFIGFLYQTIILTKKGIVLFSVFLAVSIGMPILIWTQLKRITDFSFNRVLRGIIFGWILGSLIPVLIASYLIFASLVS